MAQETCSVRRLRPNRSVLTIQIRAAPRLIRGFIFALIQAIRSTSMASSTFLDLALELHFRIYTELDPPTLLSLSQVSRRSMNQGPHFLNANTLDMQIPSRHPCEQIRLERSVALRVSCQRTLRAVVPNG